MVVREGIEVGSDCWNASREEREERGRGIGKGKERKDRVIAC